MIFIAIAVGRSPAQRFNGKTFATSRIPAEIPYPKIRSDVTAISYGYGHPYALSARSEFCVCNRFRSGRNKMCRER